MARLLALDVIEQSQDHLPPLGCLDRLVRRHPAQRRDRDRETRCRATIGSHQTVSVADRLRGHG
jgi:hypothetical protein